MNSQKKILLVPGYGTGVLRSVFKQHVSELRGFEIFKNTSTQVFCWGRDDNYSFLQAINPKIAIDLYFIEREMVYGDELQKQYLKYLRTHKPQVIVAHSMGTVLTLEILKKHRLPFVKKIIFVQSDIRFDYENQNALQKISEQYDLHNVWCFWDQALLTSVVLNRLIPLGLRPAPYFTNHFIPLWRTLNLHESSINDPKLLELTK